MKPLDPRLLRYGRAARTVLTFGALFGLVRTFAIIAWSWLLANAITSLVLPVLGGFGGASGRVGEGAYPLTSVPWLLAGALAALLLRSASSWAMDVLAARGAVRVKSELRDAALDAIDSRSPEWGHDRADAVTATVLGRGLDALDGYFSGYLPQLILTAVATPFLVLSVLLADVVSGITVILVFPVIPFFMYLIGVATQQVQDRQWVQLERLSRSFLDVVSGLSTLKIFRREAKQIERITRETDDYRLRTMRVLRVTFLSGFVLDLAGTFSIALVAVTVGTRLVAGEFPLALGLFVLLLLPEVFVPIRQVGAAFHSSTEGLTASQRIFDIIEDDTAQHLDAQRSAPVIVPLSAPPSRDNNSVGDSDSKRDHDQHDAGKDEAAAAGLRFAEVAVQRGEHTLIGPASFSVAPGEFVALSGRSGSGKSTLVAAALGFVTPQSGRIERPDLIAWAGQRPGLLQGSVAENVALGSESPDLDQVRRALDIVGLKSISAEQSLGALGAGLSGGQAQRVAIARCLYRAWVQQAPVMILDEPSSALDQESEARVGGALRAEARAGRAVLVVSHRQRLLDVADRVVVLDGAAHAESSHGGDL